MIWTIFIFAVVSSARPSLAMNLTAKLLDHRAQISNTNPEPHFVRIDDLTTSPCARSCLWWAATPSSADLYGIPRPILQKLREYDDIEQEPILEWCQPEASCSHQQIQDFACDPKAYFRSLVQFCTIWNCKLEKGQRREWEQWHRDKEEYTERHCGGWGWENYQVWDFDG